MDARSIAQADYLDILFDNRNKKYGGYALRKYEDQRSLKALLLLLACCTALVVFAILPNKSTVTNDITYKPVVTTDPEIFKPKPPKAIEPQPAQAIVKPTIQNPVPVIAPDQLVTAPPPPVDSFAGKESGPVSATGDPNSNVVATTKTSGNENNPTTAPKVEVVDYAEIMPQFAGDVYQYLGKSVRYPQAAIQNGVQGRVIIQFVVNENGHISQAKILRGIGGGCDEEALRVVNAMPAWKPGMQNGKPVKVYYRLPISFRLE